MVLPPGLAASPGTFQRLMQEVFMEELDEFITIYLKDVLVFSRTWSEHVRHLRTTFEKVRKHQLHLKQKCCLAQTAVTYLGFKVGPERIGPDPNEAKVIKDWPEVLSNRQQVRAFLGMVGYYGRMIPNFI